MVTGRGCQRRRASSALRCHSLPPRNGPPRPGAEWSPRGRGAAPAGSARCCKPLQAEREVHAALVAGQGVDLVHDHGAHGAEDLARLGAGEHQVERFGRGDQDVRRLAHHRPPLALRRVAGADGHADGRVNRGPSRRPCARMPASGTRRLR